MLWSFFRVWVSYDRCGNGEFGESETAFKKAYQLGGDQVADVHLYLASIYNRQEKYDEAEPLARQCLATRRTIMAILNRGNAREVKESLQEKSQLRRSFVAAEYNFLP